MTDKTSPGTDKDIDYYKIAKGPLLPPSQGWTFCGKNKNPGPIVMRMKEGK